MQFQPVPMGSSCRSHGVGPVEWRIGHSVRSASLRLVHGGGGGVGTPLLRRSTQPSSSSDSHKGVASGLHRSSRHNIWRGPLVEGEPYPRR